MSDDPDYSEHVKKLSTSELIKWISGWKSGSYPRLAGEHELALRKNKATEIRAWISIIISTLSLILSIIALALKLK